MRPSLTPGGDSSALFGRSPQALFASSPWRHGLLAKGGWLPAAAKLARPAAPAAPAARGWRVQPTPNVVRLRNGEPVAESCSSAKACTAVGTRENASGGTVPLAERWNGAKWRLQPIPNPAASIDTQLTGVSCPAARSCTAVGYYFNAAGDVLPVAESWNGAKWRIHATPNQISPGYGFFAVSCSAASACTAVGTADNTSGGSLALAERWNGTRWSVQAMPGGLSTVASTLLGVSCAGASACTAAGAADNSSGTSVPLALGWDGTAWTSQPIASPAHSTGSGLYAVSCQAAVCVTTGSYDNSSGATFSLAYGWNGTSWVRQAVPNPKGAESAELVDLSCIPAGAASTTCMAVGAYLTAPSKGGGGGAELTLGELWNGSRWLLRRAANPADSAAGALDAVSCSSTTACSAVGSYANSSDPADLSLAEGWNGTAWKLQASPDPLGANSSELAADSCPSSHECMAVGYYVRTANVVDTLAELWNGSAWQIVRTPNPHGSLDSDLLGVSCLSSRVCFAVGTQATASFKQTPLVEKWNGSKWVIQNVPVPAHASGISLDAVSCSSRRACLAVGSYGNHAGGESGLAERWNGKGWHLKAVPGAAEYTYLEGVSCPRAHYCAAVGYMNSKTGNAHPLAVRWNGIRWRAQRVPLLKKDPGGILTAVSCTTPDGCTAAGIGFASNGAPMAERWNGAHWKALAPLAPPDYELSTNQVGFFGVSCSAPKACTAVGTYAPDNEAESFAEAWNGSTWKLTFVPLPASAVESVLGGVSCVPRRCTTVGAWLGLSGSIVTLADTKPS